MYNQRPNTGHTKVDQLFSRHGGRLATVFSCLLCDQQCCIWTASNAKLLLCYILHGCLTGCWYSEKRDLVEVVDFEALVWRLKDCDILDSLYRLLLQLMA